MRAPRARRRSARRGRRARSRAHGRVSRRVRSTSSCSTRPSRRRTSSCSEASRSVVGGSIPSMSSSRLPRRIVIGVRTSCERSATIRRACTVLSLQGVGHRVEGVRPARRARRAAGLLGARAQVAGAQATRGPREAAQRRGDPRETSPAASRAMAIAIADPSSSAAPQRAAQALLGARRGGPGSAARPCRRAGRRRSPAR